MRRAQIFTIDLVIGLLITVSALSAVVLFLPRDPAPFLEDSHRIEFLMTEGIPAAWNQSTVRVPGFLTDNSWNATKIAAFESLSATEQRRVLGVSSDYTIRFFDNGSQVDWCNTCGAEPASYDNLLPITRWASYRDKIIAMQVHLYR